jgi:hypothetical protein
MSKRIIISTIVLLLLIGGIALKLVRNKESSSALFAISASAFALKSIEDHSQAKARMSSNVFIYIGELSL